MKRLMRPLAPARGEFRLDGLVGLGIGVLLGAALAATRAHPLRFVVGFLFAAFFFGGGMYVAVLGRYLRAALKDATEAVTPALETRSETRRRVLCRALALNVPLAALIVVLSFGSSGGALVGIAVGNGLAFLGMAHRIEHWEERKSVQILREPRWRGAWDKRRFGRGVIDPQDFYFVRKDAER